jgi:hypothetical protein
MNENFNISGGVFTGEYVRRILNAAADEISDSDLLSIEIKITVHIEDPV